MAVLVVMLAATLTMGARQDKGIRVRQQRQDPERSRCSG